MIYSRACGTGSYPPSNSVSNYHLEKTVNTSHKWILASIGLGIKGSPAFDVQVVCAGFMYALDIADKFTRTKSATKALVTGDETFARIISATVKRLNVPMDRG